MNTMIGKVEAIRFTQGSPFGEQWTTIDGYEYATWWDIRTKDWKVGDLVHFHMLPNQECHVHNGKLTIGPCATIIGKVSQEDALKELASQAQELNLGYAGAKHKE